MNARADGLACAARLGGLSLCLLLAGPLPSRAQTPPADPSSGQIQDQPLPPPPGTSETTLPGPNAAGAAVPNPPAPPAPEAPSANAAPPVAAPPQWLAAQQAQLTVLDKIYGRATPVSARIGVPFAVRFLSVTVLACWVRPPSLPPDTAAFLQVIDSHAPPGSPPEFRGWIFQAEPALSGMHDPATDISVDGCG